MESEKTPTFKRARNRELKGKHAQSSKKKKMCDMFSSKAELARLEEKIYNVNFLQEILYKKLMSKELCSDFEEVEIPTKPHRAVVDESSSIGEILVAKTPFLLIGSNKLAKNAEILRQLEVYSKTSRSVIKQILEGKGKYTYNCKMNSASTSRKLPPLVGLARQRLSRIVELLQSSSSSSSSF